MSSVIVVSTVVSLVVPVDVIGNVNVDAASVVLEVATFIVIAACVVVSKLVVGLEVVANVTTLLSVEASGDDGDE